MHELAAGKLVALLARKQARDLFDVHQVLNRGGLEPHRLRLAFVVYGAMNRKDWRTVSVNDVAFEVSELENHLIPLLRRDYLKDLGETAGLGSRLVQDCRKGLEVVLPLSKKETEFLDSLLDEGEINPSLLTSDQDLGKRIKRHPQLEWKTLNVRRYKGR